MRHPEAPPRSLRKGIIALLASGASNQVGAGIGAQAFPAIGPPGVVAVRQIVAAGVLVSIARPRIRGMTWSQWWPTLLLALVFATMNLSLYTAIDRIGLGLAVTLEFLGPLGVALLGSRTRLDLLIALSAGVGVYLLVLPDGSSDAFGIGLALLAAVCWGSYIVLNRLLGRRMAGLEGPAVATSISALFYLPVLVVLASQGRLTGLSILYAVITGIMSSVVPYAVDMVALRTVPPRLFGVLMSAQPGIAAVAGIVLLRQIPAGHEWAGIAIVAMANAVAVIVADMRRRAHSAPPASVPHALDATATGGSPEPGQLPRDHFRPEGPVAKTAGQLR